VTVFRAHVTVITLTVTLALFLASATFCGRFSVQPNFVQTTIAFDDRKV
jgi:hypothetical protein